MSTSVFGVIVGAFIVGYWVGVLTLAWVLKREGA